MDPTPSPAEIVRCDDSAVLSGGGQAVRGPSQDAEVLLRPQAHGLCVCFDEQAGTRDAAGLLATSEALLDQSPEVEGLSLELLC